MSAKYPGFSCPLNSPRIQRKRLKSYMNSTNLLSYDGGLVILVSTVSGLKFCVFPEKEIGLAPGQSEPKTKQAPESLKTVRAKFNDQRSTPIRFCHTPPSSKLEGACIGCIDAITTRSKKRWISTG